VLTKNVTVPSPAILKEHLYTLEELLAALNINCKYEELFKSIIKPIDLLRKLQFD
jgi:hypothetical protein